MRLFLMILMLLLTALCLWVGVRQDVTAMNMQTNVPLQVDGISLVESATYDGLFRYKQTLYDSNSLLPASMSVSDCPT